jgi:RNA polymerase sporulation-specific sigma factor
MDKEQMLIKYNNLIKSIASKTSINNYDYDDIVQELYMVALSCADKFDASKGIEFSTYLTKSCQYKIKELRMKHRAYPEPLDEEVGDGTTFLDMLIDPFTQTPEEWTLENDILEELDKLPYGHITRMFYLEGKSQIEIAEELGLSQSYVNKVNRKNLEHLRAIFSADSL